MNEWQFNVNGTVQDTIRQLDTTLGTYEGLVYKKEQDETPITTFKVRKRGLYAFQLLFVNKIIVKGKVLPSDYAHETTIQLTFHQHFLMLLLIAVDLILGLGYLVAIFLGKGGSTYVYLLGGLLLAMGVVLWIMLKRKFARDVQDYKTLFSELFTLDPA